MDEKENSGKINTIYLTEALLKKEEVLVTAYKQTFNISPLLSFLLGNIGPAGMVEVLELAMKYSLLYPLRQDPQGEKIEHINYYDYLRLLKEAIEKGSKVQASNATDNSTI